MHRNPNEKINHNDLNLAHDINKEGKLLEAKRQRSDDSHS